MMTLEGSPTAMQSLITALQTAFSGYVNDIMGFIGSITPVLLPVAIAIVVVTLGIKIFKKVTGK